MKKRLLAILLTICMVAALLPTAAFAANNSDAEALRALFTAALGDGGNGIVTLDRSYDLGGSTWEPLTISKDLTINGNGYTISNFVVNGFTVEGWTSDPADPTSGHDATYYTGFIGNIASGKIVTINNVNFSDAVVDNQNLRAKSSGSSILAVVVANNNGTLTYNDVNVINSTVRGYSKAGLLHGFTQNGGSFVANHCSVVNSHVVVEADGTDPEAGYCALLIGYDGGTRARTNGIKMTNCDITVDESVNWPTGVPVTMEDGTYYMLAYNGTYGVTSPTYTHGSMGINSVAFVAEVDGYQYETLADAVAAANSGDTVKLLKDITLSNTITSAKTLTLDLDSKTVTMSGTNAFLNVTAGTVTVTGDGTVSGSATSILATSGEGKIEVENGTFSSDVTKYCVLGMAASNNNDGTYTVKEAEPVTVPEDTEIESNTKTTTNDVDVSEIPEAAQETVTTTANSVAVKDATNKIVPDLSDEAAEAQAEAEEQDALVKLTANGIIEIKNDKIVLKNTETEATVTVTHEVYLEVKATGYEAGEDGSSKSLTLEIEPKYNVVATVSASGQNDQSVILAENQDAKVSGTVEVSVKLPDNFTDSETAYVSHEHNGTTYLYKGTINKENVLTFENPNGFSTFTITTKAPTSWVNRANIGVRDFDTLQEAVDDVQDGETINFVDKNSDTIYVGRTVTFTLDGPFEGQVVASNIYTTVNKTGSGDKITYTCVYTAPSVPVYRVVVNDAEGGKIKASANKAAEGATIVLTPVADDEESELETLAVVDEDGNAVTLTKRANGSYSFVMPAKAVTVTGTFTIVADPEEPDEDEEPGEEEVTVFTDVDEDAYYAEAVAWAVANEITKGTSETTFSPDDDCTRAQVVTFLWRYAGKPEPTTTENPFTDVEEDTDYYKAILWAYENGITTGTSETTFSPDETCTRAQVVTFLWRYEGELTYEEAETFTDVAEDAYYAKAVAWAVHEWITNGTGDGQFSPDETCSRGQVVTFLYRDTAEG
jgi:hypothetical protein